MLDAEHKKKLSNRLRRIEGQLAGIRRMADADEYCVDILTQISAAQSARVGPNEIGTFLRENNARLLQEAIDEILLLQKAEDAGLALNSEFIDEVVESIKTDNKIESEEEFQAALAQEGMTLDDLRANIRRSMTQRMMLNRDIEPKIQVSDETLHEEYEKRKADEFTRPATITLQRGPESLTLDVVPDERSPQPQPR